MSRAAISLSCADVRRVAEADAYDDRSFAPLRPSHERARVRTGSGEPHLEPSGSFERGTPSWEAASHVRGGVADDSAASPRKGAALDRAPTARVPLPLYTYPQSTRLGIMEIPPEVRERFREYGAIGGRRRAGRLTPQRRRAIARRAATSRWIRHRFGAASFEEAGLPGGDLIDAGLADLAEVRETPASLAVSLAAPRLEREGVPVGDVLEDPERGLFQSLLRTEGDLAHARYNAYLRQLVSFADACRYARVDLDDRAT